MPKTTVVPEGTEKTYQRFQFASAVRVGDTLYCSGQIGTGSDGKPPGDPEAQFTQAFENVAGVLQAAGMGFEQIVELTTYHVGLQEHLAAFMAVKSRYLPEPYPAWTAIGVTELAVPGGLVEIRVTARADA